MGAVHEYANMSTGAADVMRPSGLAFGNNDEPMKTFATAGAVMLLVPVPGQNLVPNGSFEEYSYCPDHWSQFGGNVTDWMVVSNSPDYMNSCRDSSDLGVPYNLFGYQFPSEGNAYVGLCTYKYNSPLFREFISVPLSTPVTAGQFVFLAMKVAPGGGGSSSTMSARWTSRGVGMRLSTQPFTWPQTSFPNSASLFLDDVLLDSVNWTVLSGSIVADSAYQYLTIGNFFEDSLSSPLVLDTTPGAQVAYVFVDEVCLSLQTGTCDGSIGYTARGPLPAWTVVNPFTSVLDVAFAQPASQTMKVILNDLSGRLIAEKVVEKGERQFRWSAGGIPSGVFVLSVLGQTGAIRPVRVLHVSP